MSYNVDAQVFETQIVIENTTQPAGATSGSIINKGSLSTLDTYVTGHTVINNVKITPNLNDIIYEQQATLANNQQTYVDITNFYFDDSICNAFKTLINVTVSTGDAKHAVWEINGLYKPSGWVITSSFTGDLTGVQFSMVNKEGGIGQVQYLNTNTDGTTIIRYRATTSAPPGTTPLGITSGVIANTSGPFITNSLVYANSTNTLATTDIVYNSNVLRIGGASRMVGEKTTNFVNFSNGGAITSMGDASVAKRMIVGEKIGIANTDPGYSLDISGDINFTGNFYKNGSLYSGSEIWSTNGTNVFYTAGNIGLGTTNPSHQLDIIGGIRSTTLTVGNVLATGITAASIQITNVNATSVTVATLLNTDAVSTNVSAATLNLSTGVTSVSAQITNANITTLTTGTALATNVSATIVTAGTLLNTNAVSTNVSAATLNLSTGITSVSAQITNVNATTVSAGTIVATTSISSAAVNATNSTVTNFVATNISSGTALATNVLATNVSSGTLNLSTGLTSASAQITDLNVTTETVGTLRATSIIGTIISAGTAVATTYTGASMSLSGDLVIGGTLTTVNITTTNVVDTNISTGTLTSTNITSTNITSATINLSSGLTSGSAQITNANITTETVGTSIITTSLSALGNSNTIGNMFTTAGNVGIGTTAPSGMLHLNGSALFTSSGDLTCIGDITAFGNISDRRFKDNIVNIPLDIALDKVKNLRPVTFTWLDTIQNKAKRGTTDAGFIAQEVEEVVEYAVGEFNDIVSGERYKKLNHERIIPYLVGAVQLLQQKIDDLERRLA